MEKPKPEITQVRAPTKWEILKEKSKYVKQYLKGRVVKGTLTTRKPMATVSTTRFDDGVFLQEHRKKRKRLNKISYASRRRNRSGL